MKIAVFVSKIPIKKAEIYGSERYTYNLSKGLAELGNCVKIFTPSTSNRIIKKDDLEIIFSKSTFKIQNYYFSYRLFIKSLKYNFDLIFVHNDSFFEMIAGVFVSLLKNIPLIIGWHGDFIGDRLLRKIFAFFLNNTLLKIILSKASVIRVPSIKYINNSNILPFFRNKVVEIPNGIEIELAKMPYSKEDCRKILKFNEQYLVLYVGHVSKVKGAELLLKSIPLVIKKNKKVKFVFIGGGDIKRFKNIAESLNIMNHVKFTGYLDGLKKWQYYKAADVFIFPSIAKHEIFGNVNIEASLFELPIIATNLDVIKGIIKNNFNGILFEKGNNVHLSNCILNLLNSEDLRKYLGKNAKSVVIKNFSLKSMVLKFHQLIQKIVENNISIK